MKITKFGHCCLLIEIDGVRLLTDPGSYSTSQNEARDVDAIIISHEHGDHLHVESLKEILKNNSNAQVITNASVGKILGNEGITYHTVADGDSMDIQGIMIEGMGTKHAEVWKEMGQVENTSYSIRGTQPDSKTLFYPGDAFYNPEREVDILALPIAGPWLAIRESIQYVLDLHPRVVFPVHEGATASAFTYKALEAILPPEGVEFVTMNAGDTKEF